MIPSRTLVLLTLLLPPAAAQSIERASLTNSGAEADAPSTRGRLSSDGQFITFESAATNLAAGDSNASADVFVRDRANGLTRLVSADAFGSIGTQESSNPRISADGRYVALESWSDNWDPNDTNGWLDVYVKDLLSGTLDRVSVDSAGQEGFRASRNASISADGRFVAFDSRANLAAGDVNFNTDDVYLRDRVLGTTVLVSVDSSGAQGGGPSRYPSVSGDGRFVAFESNAGLDARDVNGIPDVYVRDVVLGATLLVSFHPLQGLGDDASFGPAISADGRFVVFESDATNLGSAPDTNLVRDVFLWDAVGGVTERVSVGPGALQADAPSLRATISGDGRWIGYESYATNLVAGDLNGATDVFLYDRVDTVTLRASVDDAALEANDGSTYAELSGDGSVIAFTSLATDLVAADTNLGEDVFVRAGAPRWSAFCFGDGAGTPCPCGNDSPAGEGRGCVNSLGLGARLVAQGTPSAGADTLVLVATGLPNSTAVFVQGTGVENGGFGSPLADGLLCLGGTLTRLRARPVVAGGVSFPGAGDPAIGVLGGALPGATRTYQAIYRNAAAFCTPGTSNATNALQLTWTF
ncbi:MAG: PD40 domain-containing protein [Planctomycetes bacterium]|nr:PD40 domain-containing protein [Planctomycetota bacterium]